MKVKIDKELIEHTAEVARLKLTEKEKAKFSKELNEVIGAFSNLDEVDTKGIDISLQPVELKNVFEKRACSSVFVQRTIDLWSRLECSFKLNS